MKVFDADGNELGSVPLTPTQIEALETGANIAVLFHTPRMLQGQLGAYSGSFSLHKEGERICTTTPAAFKDFLRLRAGIQTVKAARES